MLFRSRVKEKIGLLKSKILQEGQDDAGGFFHHFIMTIHHTG